MKIGSRIVLACAALCVVSVLLTGGILAWQSLNLSEASISNRAQQQLISVRAIKQQQIEDYFETISKQLLTQAGSLSVVEAVESFSSGFDAYVNNKDSEISSLKKYYEDEFRVQYGELNAGRSVNVNGLLSGLSPQGLGLQATYIGANQYPLGEKYQLLNPNDGSQYSQTHEQFHPYFSKFLDAFGYYDIFLINPEGDIVYSVFKELDFATNLKQGPYRNSGLANVFNKAVGFPSGKIAFDDFKPYLPSYESAASFVATPLYRDNQLVGVIAFQMPVDRINGIMTFFGKWETAGLGLSGETYLVGSDNLLRSQPRGLVEDVDSYVDMIRRSGMASGVVNEIADKASAIGIQSITTIGVQNALKGQSGVARFMDYRGEEVLSAYTSLTVFDQSWALMSEIDAKEALKDIEVLQVSVWTAVAITAAVVIVLALLAASVVGKSISAPVKRITDRVKSIGATKDLTMVLDIDGKDEVAELAQSLNSTFGEVREVLGDVATLTAVIDKETASICHEMNDAVGLMNTQSSKCEAMATASNEMSVSIQEVASFAGRSAELVDDVNRAGNESEQIGQNLQGAMNTLSEEMEKTTISIERLRAESTSISDVLEVIQAIAEQTNLLALNAAIEAARAGEHGRGFAVVADEVRTLATRTQQSTGEIRTKIESLQLETQATVENISQVSGLIEQGRESVANSSEKMHEISGLIGQVHEMSSQIAAAAEEQSSVTEDISHSTTDIADGASHVSGITEGISGVVSGLADQSTQLHKEVNKFTY
ncbi:methyl-accepting chemotaxis protein [Thaumasiovibrio subtropicus]|uniref:methyl-accepting chemotaxis protein n=1 Tax=Thaumasiovibrio subtropicus TaxID=1891207 RepID=UPI000B354074|nr:methyl-accepting chemotaxis protein [Thaumasiovibrio subtropicus]